MPLEAGRIPRTLFIKYCGGAIAICRQLVHCYSVARSPLDGFEFIRCLGCLGPVTQLWHNPRYQGDLQTTVSTDLLTTVSTDGVDQHALALRRKFLRQRSVSRSAPTAENENPFVRVSARASSHAFQNSTGQFRVTPSLR